jgi:2-polyprenyl-3-methyl-5-hydroxy-6-metoxy-1,4-benzoquinol methylase
VLDIGAADGALFRRLGDRIGRGVGIDPDAPEGPAANDGRFRFIRGRFPDDLDPVEQFDVVTAMAFFEHVPDAQRHSVAAACFRAIKPGGLCILTVPSAAVDTILDVLIRLRIVDGMHEEEHHGFDAARTPEIFQSAGFTLHTRRRFQMRVNNLFVFSRPSAHIDVLVEAEDRQEEAAQHDP